MAANACEADVQVAGNKCKQGLIVNVSRDIDAISAALPLWTAIFRG